MAKYTSLKWGLQELDNRQLVFHRIEGTESLNLIIKMFATARYYRLTLGRRFICLRWSIKSTKALDRAMIIADGVTSLMTD